MQARSVESALFEWLAGLDPAGQCYAGACLAQYIIVAVEGRFLSPHDEVESLPTPHDLTYDRAAEIRQIVDDLAFELHLYELTDLPAGEALLATFGV